ncbi:MAG: nucleotidyltransferase family protein [Candidatus Sungbacteria bacterium]|nr:nucleotidyltransferase family protein [Candidatus Sungbacteria bacterium]
MKELEGMLQKNRNVQFILERAPLLAMPNWYLGAGCLAQTVWNTLHGFDPEQGIKDYDLVYFDAADVSYEGEDRYIQKGKELFGDVAGDVEIRNQARVHLWHEKHFGYAIEPHKSVERAISTWPTTATTIGVKKYGDEFQVYAACGLDDLFGMIIRANKILVSKEVYRKKVDRWTKIWPMLKVIPWET